MTVLEENIRGSMGPQVKQRFLRRDTKTMVHKRKKYDKLDLIKIQIFCISKDTIKKMKKQTNLGENIYETHI